MRTPMPSPRGTNHARLYINSGSIAAYDARGGLADIFDGLSPEEYGRRAYRRLAYDDTNPAADPGQSDPDDDADIAKMAAWIKANMSYEQFQNLVMALQDDGETADDDTGLGEEIDRESGSSGSQPGGSTSSHGPVDLGGNQPASPATPANFSTYGNLEDRRNLSSTSSRTDFKTGDLPQRLAGGVAQDFPRNFRGRRGGAKDEPPDFRGRPHTGGKMTAMDGSSGSSPFYGSMDSARPRRSPALSTAQRLSLDELCPGLSRIKII
jgi:hypothetical protein